jgi:glutamyl-tRNA reductase
MNMSNNFIRVEHKGQTVSIVQHWHRDRVETQEVAILPNDDAAAIEHILHFSHSLDSLIGVLQIMKRQIEEETKQ